MANTISGREYPLSKIFCKDFDFYIPSYQRPYSWEEQQVETLMDNLVDSYRNRRNDEYFLGSLVLIKQDNNPQADVIDGQQRLTTLTIVFSTLANLLSQKNKEQCRKYIVEEGNPFEDIIEQPRLHLREKDRDFFKNYIQMGEIDALLKLDLASLSNESQQHIKNNCKIIFDKLKSNFKTEEDRFDFCKYIVSKCYWLLCVLQIKNRLLEFFLL